MADTSAIEWTDATWNVLTGCSLESPGCIGCYAMKLAGSRLRNHPSRIGLTRPTKTGPVWTGEVRFNEMWLRQPLEWKRPREIFVCAHSDLFHPKVPQHVLDQIFAVMALAGHHTFQVLTKRHERMRTYFWDDGVGGWKERVLAWMEALKPSDWWNGNVLQARHELATNGVLPNVWLGVSAEDQKRATQRIPYLLSTPAAHRYVSCEPLIGEINLEDVFPDLPGTMNALTGEARHLLGERRQVAKLDWVIVGGESGPRARPMHVKWARKLRDQCDRAGVMFMFKQWGNWVPEGQYQHREIGAPQSHRFADGLLAYRMAKGQAGRRLDGHLHDDVPGTA